jgi:hypothetical protein
MDILTYLRGQWDRVLAVVCIAIGAAALLIGWLGVSNSVFVAEQMPYIVSGGLVGLFFLGLGAMLWLSADIRDEWRTAQTPADHAATSPRSCED